MPFGRRCLPAIGQLRAVSGLLQTGRFVASVGYAASTLPQ